MEQNVILNARDSDPEKLKWMMGFPPEKEKIISAKDGSFFEFPALRYSVNHMREFFPTRNVSVAKTDLYKFRHDLDKKIDEITFVPWNVSSTSPMTFAESLEKNYVDGIIIMHNEKIVYEKYPEFIKQRFDVDYDFEEFIELYDRFCTKRGFIMRGNEIDYTRAGKAFIDEFRAGKFGKITLE